MSMFDPRAPNGPNNAFLTYEPLGDTFEFKRSLHDVVLRAALTASANVTISTTNVNARGAIFFFNIESLPGSASTTLALKVHTSDPVTGKAVAIANAVARSATGISTLVIHPDALSAAGATKITNFALPRNLRCYVSQSSGATSKDVVWSLGMAFLP